MQRVAPPSGTHTGQWGWGLSDVTLGSGHGHTQPLLFCSAVLGGG